MEKTPATPSAPTLRDESGPASVDSAAALDALDDAAAGQVFLSTYPRREARADGLKAWQQTRAVRPALSVLIDALAAHAMAGEWSLERRKFIPLPATWLRGHRWSDDFSAGLSPLLVSRLDAYKAKAQGKAVAQLADLEAASQAAGDARMRRLLQQRTKQQGAPLQVVARRAAPVAEAQAVGGVLELIERKRA